jgi:hypothetical protein
MSEIPTRDDFAKHLNTKFRVEIGAEKWLEMELTEVTEMRRTTRQESFALIFLAPGDTAPDQRIYQMRHDALGALEIFLVPVSLDKRGLRFEALFNSLIKGEDDL